MSNDQNLNITSRIRRFFIGRAKSPLERGVFHSLALAAFFAWVGLGADGLSSSCYGPEEAFLALGQHGHLSLFIALASAVTIFVISASYAQIIELFPTGGGGYLVASKLLSPAAGMVSGCALLIDYVLTIAISVASGADAVFSFLPLEWQSFKLWFAAAGALILVLLNLRGAKESVVPLVPVFLLFLVSHIFIIGYAFFYHPIGYSQMIHTSLAETASAHAELGTLGLIFILLRAYSMGAGTYTGIEAVSNGLSILKEPRVVTGKRTMCYMALSLAFMVMGLMVAYLLFSVQHVPGKTLNAVLFETITASWGAPGVWFVRVLLLSEALLLFIAAQAGFLDGPRVLSNMALDRWFPTKFSTLSDRLVTQNGILLMGFAALATLALTRGSVRFLVVLYSINVFITFVLSQLGMVRHWWQVRKTDRSWIRKGLVNGIGLILCVFILASVVIIKFHDGGWITLIVTGTLVGCAVIVKRHYLHTAKLLKRLGDLLPDVAKAPKNPFFNPKFDPQAKTAALLVNGFNGLGMHTLFNVTRYFGKEFRNFVFIEIGVIDAGTFKGADEVDRLRVQGKRDVDRYADYMRSHGYFAEGFVFLGLDVASESEKIVPQIREQFPNVVFFGGQLVFPKESFMTRLLHNHTVFILQRRFYQQGVPFVILPIRV